MSVGQRLKQLRESKNLTQEDVAKFLNTTPQTIYKYEKGIVTNIPLNNIEALAGLFGVSPNYIAGWEDEPQIHTIAAHHDGEWTEEELDEIERFKKYVLSKREK